MTPAFPSKPCAISGPSPGAWLSVLHGAERVVAFIALVLMAPVALGISVAIFALSRQSPLVCHKRVGWQGAPLFMLKFRTMWTASEPVGRFFTIEKVSGVVPASKGMRDSRVTSRFAAFCRRYSLDELPQLYHVVRGEMSLVGPRPITMAELRKHYRDCADEVVSQRPGLTGLWQIMGRNHLTYAERRDLDLELVRRSSAGLYLRILLRSIPTIIRGSGA